MRHRYAAVAAVVCALGLAACDSSSTPDPTVAPSATPSETPTQQPASQRPLVEGYDFDDIANTIRTSPGWADKDNNQIMVLLNGTCDALDANATPEAAVTYLTGEGIGGVDVFLGVSAATTILCPEHAAAVA